MESLFFIANSAVDFFQLGYLEILINSIYFQVIAFFGIGGMLRNIRLDNTNFDVYKAEKVTV